MTQLWVTVLAAAMPLLGVTSDEKTILELEKRWSAANVHKDVTVLEQILAEDYIGIEAIGMVGTKTQEIAGIKTGDVVVDAEEPTQMKVRMYGDVAVVTGHLSVRDRRDGKAGQHEVVFTDVWVKRDGRWQVVNYQGTLVPLRSSPK